MKMKKTAEHFEKHASTTVATSLHNASTLDETESINVALRKHQNHLDDWDKAELIGQLNALAELFIFQFKLETSIPAIMLDCLDYRRYGHFRLDRNGFGMLNEIAINEKYIDALSFWQIASILLHELIHAEQQHIYKLNNDLTERGNYHNKAFRQRALLLGLIVDQKGHTRCVPPPSPLFDVLDKAGIEFCYQAEDIESENLPIIVGKSKLKPWICSCNPKPIHVQVAVKDFEAICLKCGHRFVKKEK